VFYSQDENKIK
jgi:hypothetical protein